MPVPTVRLAFAVALASLVVLALPVGAPVGIVVVDALVVVVAAVDALLAPGPALIGVDRDLPGGLVLGGDDGQVRWRVANPTGRRLRVEVADELAPSLQASFRRFSVTVPPGGQVTAVATVTPTRRGRFEPCQVVVRVRGPLGLAARQGTRQLPAVLRVLPRFRSRKEAELRIERGRLLEVGLRSAQGRGGGTDFDTLREYSVDDEVRRIDWAATARSGKAIVRTYRAERNQQVIVMLDTGRLMAGQVDGVPRLEWAMDAALTLTSVSTRLGDRCGLVTFDRDVRGIVPPRSGPGQLARVTEAMFDVDARLVESDYRGAFAATLGRFRRRAFLVLVTELSEEAVGETLLPALPMLLARHIVVVASVVDPQVAEWAEEVPTEAGHSYRSAAAVRALEGRARTAGLLRALGATVVDARPGDVSARLADAYLAAKAVGRL